MFARLMGLHSISPRGLHELMQREAVTIIDVNSRAGWLAGRVPGALNLDSASFGSGDLPTDRDAVVVFYCSGFMCRKAPNAARRAAAMGYRRVQVMSAGITGWVNAGLPTESGEGRAFPPSTAVTG